MSKAHEILDKLLSQYRHLPRPDNTLIQMTLNGRMINAALDYLDSFQAEGGKETEDLGTITLQVVAVDGDVQLRFDGKMVARIQGTAGLLKEQRAATQPQSNIQWR